MEYGSLILLSSTSCFTIIFNSLLAPLCVGEKFSWFVDGLTIVFVTIGCTLCLSF